MMDIDARDLAYRELNDCMGQSALDGARDFVLHNVQGHRYIGTRLGASTRVQIHGTPGNDLGAFMDGAELVVHGNAQDAIGNTMNAGRIVVYGGAGDVAAHSMRGGEVFIRQDAGYRAGIHMKASGEQSPLLVIGGGVRDFLGEYMAGGTLIVLGLDSRRPALTGGYVGTGMHGGVIYLRGQIEPYILGQEASFGEMTDVDWRHLRHCLEPFCELFGHDLEEVLDAEYTRLAPTSTRPYGRLYVGSVGAIE